MGVSPSSIEVQPASPQKGKFGRVQTMHPAGWARFSRQFLVRFPGGRTDGANAPRTGPVDANQATAWLSRIRSVREAGRQ